ncbi:zf-HC2 domain-containing protein [Chloroflexota bacterium]
MKCSDFKEFLSAYANDELSLTQKEFIEGHLSGCAGCQCSLVDYIDIKRHVKPLKELQSTPDLSRTIMSQIKGNKAGNTTRKWLRPALVSLPVIAIMITLFIIQPWNGANGPKSVLANVISASENIQSYRVLNFSSSTSLSEPDAKPTILERIWEFVLPDRAHVIYNNSYYSTSNGVVSRVEETSEFYVIGESLYYLTNNDMDTFLNRVSPFHLTGGIPTKESALGMLQFMGELQQLPDETLDGVDCLHYTVISRWGSLTPVEVWIGKDDYLIRQMSQSTEDENAISTNITRYYDFNANISIEPPLVTSGELLPGWAVENIELASSLIPIDEAIEAVSGNQDWSDPTVLEKVIEMMNKVRDPWVYFYKLPSEAQEAVIDFIVNSSQVDVRTTTVEVSSGYNDGVFRYSNGGTGMNVVIDTGWAGGEDSGVKLGTTEAIDLWWNAILAPDPQAYFNALPEETRQAMAVALSDDAIFMTITHELGRYDSIEIEIP